MAFSTLLPGDVDVSVAHPARIIDYLLGGKDNFTADREAGDQLRALRPEIVGEVRARHRFRASAVRYLASEAGIEQFIDIGVGLPGAGNTHEVAQSVAPAARVVYVDNDPIVLTHARAHLTSGPEGRVDHLDADLRDTDEVLAQAAKTLDLGQPVGLLYLMVLQFIPDSDDPHGLVRAMLHDLAPDSYLVVADTVAVPSDPRIAECTRRVNDRMGGLRQVRRTAEVLGRLFDGLELVDPGLTPVSQWRPDPGEPAAASPDQCGVARKPA
jgi:hypothetical protein